MRPWVFTIVWPLLFRMMSTMSIFHEGESRGGQFQKMKDKLPKPREGLQRHSVIERVCQQLGQCSRAEPDWSSHSPIAFAMSVANGSPIGSISEPHEGQLSPSQTSPSAHSLNPLPICGST